jgi:ACR3 family arsenite transporter
MSTPTISDERQAAALGAPGDTVPSAVARRLSTLDRYLPVWIGVAMGVGLGLGALIPGLESALSAVAIGGTSLPIAIGLLLMMYPVLARVRSTRS